MWMLCSGIYMQIGKDLPSKTVLGQHASYGTLDHILRLSLQQILGDCYATTSWVSTEILILLGLHLVAGHSNLLGIDDDHVIATVNMRCEIGFVLAS